MKFYHQTNALIVQVEHQQQDEEDGIFVVGMEPLPPPASSKFSRQTLMRMKVTERTTLRG